MSTVRCINFQPQSDRPLSPVVSEEANDLRALIIKGFHVIGALIVGGHGESVDIAREAVDSAIKLRKSLCVVVDDVHNSADLDLIGASVDSNGGEVRFFSSKRGNVKDLEAVSSIVYEEEPEKYIWERGCLLSCELPIKLPVYISANKKSDAQGVYFGAHEALIARFKDPQLTFMVESLKRNVEEVPDPVIVRGVELDSLTEVSDRRVSDVNMLPCSHFLADNKQISSVCAENAGVIQVTVLLNRSDKSSELNAPIAEFCPASEEARLWVVDYKLEVVCYAVKDLPLSYAISNLIIPALADQLNAMKSAILPYFLKQHPQLRPYHFTPPGILHPITVIYELTYGEMETKQVELRKSLHLRLGLPTDRPLLRVANSLKYLENNSNTKSSGKRGSTLLKDVHIGITSSGVSGGHISLVQGSYEYYHYLHDGFDDSGWGCAYRSLQTIISWFRQQHYTAIDVPTHREIQQALVDIGDKDPSLIGSREWIGAIELSYVLDKLLGVTCKVMNVRSGSELPEKCRELAVHFESQGTPIMIGGGVLAYTLLGVDYNETSGDCAFLILDPHYTGSDDLKKIVNSGWCGWKKAVDGKGKSFFLHDKFYNLLLPQRPDMV